MLTTKKVIEEAIKVREDELRIKKDIQYIKCHTVGECEFIKSDIENFESQIAELAPIVRRHRNRRTKTINEV